MNIEEKVMKIVEEPLKKEGYKVLEVKYEKENKLDFLRIFIDTTNIDDCVKATEIINPILDEYDLIDHEYYLEVSSKGGN